MTGQPAHISPSELAGYLDRDLDIQRRRRVEAHLDACALCRDELIEVARLTESARASGQVGVPFIARTTRRRVWVGLTLGGALAASLALAVLRAPMTPDSAIPTQPVRALTTGEGLTKIDVIVPPDSLRGSGGSPVFTWHSVGADVYRFALLSESGEELWTGETPDTSLTLPTALVLSPGRVYWWRVDATAAGIVGSTGARQLKVSP